MDFVQFRIIVDSETINGERTNMVLKKYILLAIELIITILFESKLLFLKLY